MVAEIKFSILRKPELVVSSYNDGMTKELELYLKDLRKALSFIKPEAYRGISREPLEAYPPTPQIIEMFKEDGLDMESNKRARIKFLEILDEDWGDNSESLPSFDEASEVFSLLETPDEYEIVSLSIEPFDSKVTSLGFDVGYWGSEYFSIICDCAAMPGWHGPDPKDFNEIAEKLKKVNENFLFSSPAHATEFKDYYINKPWAETEGYPGQFCIIQAGFPKI